jgi:hypothetical protein
MLKCLFRHIIFNLLWLMLDEGDRLLILKQLRGLQPCRIWRYGTSPPLVIGS